MMLFCIPHAGGSTLSYMKWKKYLDKKISFMPLDLPGHITRQEEPLSADFSHALEDLYQNIVSVLSEQEEYSIFGHSLGSVFAYELYAKLDNARMRLPTNLFFSGRWPPYISKNEDRTYQNYEDFRNNFEMQENLKNVPEVEKTLGEYFYRVIYADLKLLDTYQKEPKPHRIDSEITVLWGSEDSSMNYKDVSAWKAAAEGQINFKLIAGAHLFPIENTQDTVDIINQILIKD